MIKGNWILDTLNKFLSILNMNSIISNFRVKNILQTVFSHKFIGKNTNTFFFYSPDFKSPTSFLNFRWSSLFSLLFELAS